MWYDILKRTHYNERDAGGVIMIIRIIKRYRCNYDDKNNDNNSRNDNEKGGVAGQSKWPLLVAGCDWAVALPLNWNPLIIFPSQLNNINTFIHMSNYTNWVDTGADWNDHPLITWWRLKLDVEPYLQNGRYNFSRWKWRKRKDTLNYGFFMKHNRNISLDWE